MLTQPKLLTLLFLMMYYGVSAQTESRPDISMGLGISYGVLHMTPNNGLQSGGPGGLAAIFIENRLHPNTTQWRIQLGGIYHYRQINDYESAPFYGTYQKPIHVITNAKQHLFETQFMIKYRPDKSKFSVGAGANVSFLFMSTLNQSVTEPVDSTTYRRILYNYERKDDKGIHTFNRFNLAPTINIGFRLSEKIQIEYYLGYDLLAPSQAYLNYEQFHLLNNSIFIHFKLN